MRKYEIQQDNANNWRVIQCDGKTRRAVDHPPCRSRAEALRVLAAIKCDE